MTSAYFSYDKPKVLQALRYHFVSRREIKVMVILVNLFAVFSATLYFLKKVSAVAFLTSSVLWFILMISFWFVLPGIIYRRSSTFKDEFKVSFEEQHMFLENPRGGRSWPWTAFKYVIESPHFFHLYFDSRSFFIIPKEAFQETSIQEARHYLQKKIKNKK